LLRHALLQLPPDESADKLRHQLVLRIAYVEMLAWSASGNQIHLQDAERMLQRYLGRHEALFGDDRSARAARGEVYEILYEVERRLEGEVESGVVAHAAPAEAAASSITLPVALTQTNDVPEVERRPEPKPRRARTTKREEPDAKGDVRVVRVNTRKKLDVDDPETRKLLKSAFSDPEMGSVLTGARMVEVHGPRPLVRLAAAPAAVEADSADDRRRARELGRTLVRVARPELRECYADAFARLPVSSTEAVVELSVHPDGSISGVRIIEGGLVDGLGDVCVIEQLQAARLESPEVVASQRVRVPLEFIYQGTGYIFEPAAAPPLPVHTTANETILVGPQILERAKRNMGLP
jgi:hypothetical protein